MSNFSLSRYSSEGIGGGEEALTLRDEERRTGYRHSPNPHQPQNGDPPFADPGKLDLAPARCQLLDILT